MGFDLYREFDEKDRPTDYFRWNIWGFPPIRFLGEMYGWIPMGTIAHSWTDDEGIEHEEEKCGYETNDGIWKQEVSYRKNKTDVNQNAIFDFTTYYPNKIAGNDSDGVDLNRNYGLNWFLGDNKYELNLQSCPSNQTYSSN